jgi:hypothetical protein
MGRRTRPRTDPDLARSRALTTAVMAPGRLSGEASHVHVSQPPSAEEQPCPSLHPLGHVAPSSHEPAASQVTSQAHARSHVTPRAQVLFAVQETVQSAVAQSIAAAQADDAEHSISQVAASPQRMSPWHVSLSAQVTVQAVAPAQSTPPAHVPSPRQRTSHGRPDGHTTWSAQPSSQVNTQVSPSQLPLGHSLRHSADPWPSSPTPPSRVATS